MSSITTGDEPIKILKESIILTNLTPITIGEQVRNKLETLV